MENISISYCVALAIAALPVLIIFRFVIQPYLSMQFYIKQDPQNSISFFFPFLGIQKYLKWFFTNCNDSHELFKKAVRDNPNLSIIVSHMGSKPLIYFVDTKLVREFSQNNVVNYAKRRFWKFLELNFGNGVFFKERRNWREQRSFLGHAFHYEHLKSLLPLVQRTTQEFLDDLDARVEKVGKLDIQILKEFEIIVGEIILRAFFSMDMKTQNLQGKALTIIFAEAIQNIFIRSREFLNFVLCDIFGDHMAQKTLSKNDQKLKFDVEIIRQIGTNAIRDRLSGKVYHDDFFQKYIDAMKKSREDAKLDPNVQVIEEEDVLSQFMTFFFAGMDTTGHLIGIAIYHLAKFPEYHKRLMEELDTFIREECDFNSIQLNKCVFLTAFLNECLRKYPPAPVVFFRNATQDHQIGNFKIKKGTVCTAAFTSIHNNPKYYKDPQIFNPDRWLDENQKLKDQFAFIPFSTGQRNCIGQHLAQMDAKIIIINFLRRYDIELHPKNQFQMSCTLLYGPVEERLVRISRKKYNN